ncbi:MAG: hypothetical protein KGM15_10415 [Pseudomonadota bacterium]|nr:hypothetical protein [Pseudomonadota bacterium]
MFRWLFRRKKADEEFLLKMMKAAAEGAELARLRQAVSTISNDKLEGDGTAMAGNAAGILTTSVVTAAIFRANDNDDRFTAGLFALVAANHFARITEGNFEIASVLSVLQTVGTEEFERCFSSIVSSHNQMIQSGSNVVPAIGQACAIWMNQPSSENFEKLVGLFKVVREYAAKAP